MWIPSLYHSFTICNFTAISLYHGRNSGAMYKRGNGKEKRRVVSRTEHGKEGSCRHLTSSDQNSETDQVDVKFVPPSPSPSSFTPYPQGSYRLLLFFMPASSLHTSSNPSPISPLRPLIALCITLFLTPILLALLLLAFFPYPLHPPQGPLLPFPLQLIKGGINEGVHINLWWPVLTSFNQSGES